MIQVDLFNSLILAVSGFAIGFVGGMVGLVLGVVRFPVVMNIETSASITAGTNLGVSTLGAIAAALRHYRLGNIHFRLFLILGLTGAAGAFIGSFLTGYVPVSYLLGVIGIIVLYESYMLLKGSRTKQENINRKEIVEKPKSTGSENSDRRSVYTQEELIILESIIGFGIGVLGGLVGLVLGSIRMLAMISVLKMEPRFAVGTNLAAAAVMGISGLIGHIINHNIDYLVLIIMGSGAMIGGYLGARYTNRFSERILKRLIGIVLIVVAISMFLRVFELTTHVLD
ncbi:MAG: sulfite exporter TauE/SafE family protein [Nitrososphaeraceae archaeon]